MAGLLGTGNAKKDTLLGVLKYVGGEWPPMQVIFYGVLGNTQVLLDLAIRRLSHPLKTP
jgi:hypothetical protein